MRKKDWTGIHFLEKTSYYDGKRGQLGALAWLILSFAAFVLIQLSSFAILFHGLSMEFKAWQVGAVMVGAALIFWLLSPWWPLLLGGVGVLCAGLGIFAWVKFDGLSAGFMSIYDRGAVLVSDYMMGITDSGDWSGELAFGVYAFVAVLLCLYGGLCYFALKSALPVLIPGIAAVTGVFFVGKVPDIFWLAVFFIAACVFVSGSYTSLRFGRYGTLTALGSHFYIRAEKPAVYKIGAKSGILLAALLALGALLAAGFGQVIGMPEEEKLADYQQQIRDWSQENLKLFENWGTKESLPEGGINGGDLASVGDMYYHGDEQIKVTVGVRPESNLYIKAYVGDTYENNRWNVGGSGDYTQLLAAVAPHSDTDVFSYSYELLSEFGQDHMEIEKLAVFGSYEFFPYGVLAKSSSGWVKDLYIQGTGQTQYFNFTPMIYPLAGDYDDLTARASQFLAGNFSMASMEEAYGSYVRDAYLQVPQSTRNMLNSLTGGAVPETLKEKVVYVRALLRDTCTYSLTPGSLPEGKDFTEYFLMENRRGYCMHFATAATLLLRDMGVPARYVEGYIMAPANFHPSAGGYEGIAYDHQAHAWTEIYLDGVGWLPVEVTPAYYDTAALTDDMDESSETLPETWPESESMSESEPQSEETQDSSPEDEAQSQDEESESQTDENGAPIQDDTDSPGGGSLGGQGSQGSSDGQASSGGSGGSQTVDGAGQTKALRIFLTVLLWIVVVAVVLAAAVAVVVLRAAAISRKRVHSMRQPDRSKAVIAIYRHLLRLFEICGYPAREAKNLHLYFERVAKDHDFIDVDACDALVALANEAAFSRDGITTEQWQSCWQLYQQIRNGMYQDQKRAKQLWMKYFYGC